MPGGRRRNGFSVHQWEAGRTPDRSRGSNPGTGFEPRPPHAGTKVAGTENGVFPAGEARRLHGRDPVGSRMLNHAQERVGCRIDTTDTTTITPMMLSRKPAWTISLILRRPVPNTMAFGGVATGIMKAHEAAMAVA